VDRFCAAPGCWCRPRQCCCVPIPSILRAMTPDHAANAWDPLRHSKQEWISTIHHGAPLTSCMPGLRGICLLHFGFGSDTGRAVLLLHHDCFHLQAGMHINSELSAYASSTKHVTRRAVTLHTSMRVRSGIACRRSSALAAKSQKACVCSPGWRPQHARLSPAYTANEVSSIRLIKNP